MLYGGPFQSHNATPEQSASRPLAIINQYFALSLHPIPLSINQFFTTEPLNLQVTQASSHPPYLKRNNSLIFKSNQLLF